MFKNEDFFDLNIFTYIIYLHSKTKINVASPCLYFSKRYEFIINAMVNNNW